MGSSNNQEGDSYNSFTDSIEHGKEGQAKGNRIESFEICLKDKSFLLRDEEMLEESYISLYEKLNTKHKLNKVLMRLIKERDIESPNLLILSICYIFTIGLIPLYYYITKNKWGFFLRDFIVVFTDVWLLVLEYYIVCYYSGNSRMKSYLKRLNKHWKNRGIDFTYIGRNYVEMKVSKFEDLV